MSAQLTVAVWLTLWAAACAILAARPLIPNRSGTFALRFGPALAIGLTAAALLEPGSALAEGTAGVMLAAAAPVDVKTGYLFDSVTLPAATLCILIAALERTTTSAFWGVAAIVAPLAVLAFISRGGWIGWGDVKACLSLAIAFGGVGSAMALFIASVSGLAAHAMRLHRGRSIPFGPHLAAGAATVIIFGSQARHLLEELGR